MGFKGGTHTQLKGHEDWVNSVAISADGTKAVSGSSDNTVGVWDLKGGTHTQLKGHERWVSSVAINADGTKAVSGSDDNTVGVWDLVFMDYLQKPIKSLKKILLLKVMARHEDGESVLPAVVAYATTRKNKVIQQWGKMQKIEQKKLELFE